MSKKDKSHLYKLYARMSSEGRGGMRQARYCLLLSLSLFFLIIANPYPGLFFAPIKISSFSSIITAS